MDWPEKRPEAFTKAYKTRGLVCQRQTRGYAREIARVRARDKGDTAVVKLD